MEDKIESRLNLLFVEKNYLRFEASTTGSKYGWDHTRQFFAFYGVNSGEYDYYAMNVDGSWWRGGANIPDVMGWDIGKLAEQAGV